MSVELECSELAKGEGVERDERDSECAGGIGRVERGADRVGVDRERDGDVGVGDRHRPDRIDEDELATLQDAEQRPESLLDGVAAGAALRQDGEDVVAVEIGRASCRERVCSTV